MAKKIKEFIQFIIELLLWNHKLSVEKEKQEFEEKVKRKGKVLTWRWMEESGENERKRIEGWLMEEWLKP